MQGYLRAIARLTGPHISTIDDNEEGCVIVPVVITDESDQEPIECYMARTWVKNVLKRTIYQGKYYKVELKGIILPILR